MLNRPCTVDRIPPVKVLRFREVNWEQSVVASIGVGIFLLTVVPAAYWFLLELEIWLSNLLRLLSVRSVTVARLNN